MSSKKEQEAKRERLRKELLLPENFRVNTHEMQRRLKKKLNEDFHRSMIAKHQKDLGVGPALIREVRTKDGGTTMMDTSKIGRRPEDKKAMHALRAVGRVLEDYREVRNLLEPLFAAYEELIRKTGA